MSGAFGAVSLPTVLIVLGIVVIGAIFFLLMRMKREQEETPAPVEKKREKKEETTAQPPVTSAPRAPAAEPKKTKPSPQVIETPIGEVPNVEREDFEKFLGKRLLIVEDNKINQKLILTLLKDSGIDLETADDGVEALEKLREPGRHIDMVLMDVNMPRMDGLEATREIRRDPRLCDIPVVALTASTSEEEVSKILDSGMNAFLDKPIVLGKLYHVFDLFMTRYRREPQEEPQQTRKARDRVEAMQIAPEILDTQTGLAYTNDAELYLSVLRDFLTDYGDADKKMKTWYAEKAYEPLQEMVIDLEAISGTIGAQELTKRLSELREVLERHAYPLLEDYIDDYIEAHRRLMDALRTQLPAA